MRLTSGRSHSTHGAFNRCQVARQQWLWSKVTTQCVSCYLHAGTQAGGEYLAFFSGCSQAATRCAMMKRALKVPHGDRACLSRESYMLFSASERMGTPSGVMSGRAAQNKINSFLLDQGSWGCYLDSV